MKRINIRRITAVILTAALVLSLSTGCSKKAKDDAIVLDWFMMSPNSTMETKDVEMVENAVNEIIYPELGCKLDFHFYDRSTYAQKLNVMMQTGEKIDIVFLSGSGKFGSKSFLDLTDMLETYAPDILAKTEDLVWKAVKVDGAIRAIPGQNVWARTWGWVLKKDLVEKYKFDYANVHELKDLEPFLAAVKAGEPGITPILMAKTGYLNAPGQQTWCNQICGSIIYDVESKKFVRQLQTNQETIDRYRLMWEWYQKGYIAKDALALDSYQSEAKTGKYAVVNNAGKYDKTFEASRQVYGYDTVEIYGGINKYVDASSVAVVSNAIGATCKYPEKALQVLNMIWKDPELSNLIAYGIEGVHYTVDKKRSEEIGSKSVIPKSGNEVTYSVAHNWIGPLWDQWDSSWNRLDALKELQDLNETVKTSGSIPGCFGFVFDSDKFKTEVASVAAVMNAAKPVLETGSAPDFDKYLANVNKKLTNAGIDKLVDEINRQYQEWLKNNQ